MRPVHDGRSPTTGRKLALVAAGLLFALAGGTASAQRDYGRAALTLDERTDLGTWGGTWWYVSRDHKVALWFRGEPAAPELKLRLLNLNSGEGFETDWKGAATYVHNSKPGTFTLEILQRDANTIEADWSWKLGIEELARTEVATILLYRTGDGRSMTMNFEGLERIHGGPRPVRLAFAQVWNFTKASPRLVLWDELPF
jgi:hypothetical protein